METVEVDVGQCSLVDVLPPVGPRKLAKVPFVELADGRLQGVVSSGSDVSRVYVSSIAAGSHAFSCSTNNNRPCTGAHGRLCKHLGLLVTEAVMQYGAARVADFLRVPVTSDDASAEDVLSALSGPHQPRHSGAVFHRFLRHLAYLEVPDTTLPLPELHWFPAAGAPR